MYTMLNRKFLEEIKKDYLLTNKSKTISLISITLLQNFIYISNICKSFKSMIYGFLYNFNIYS